MLIQICKELELEIQREHERQQQLEQYASLWRKSQDIKYFIGLIKKEADQRNLIDDQTDRLERWCDWALRYSEKIDPINIILDQLSSEESE